MHDLKKKISKQFKIFDVFLILLLLSLIGIFFLFFYRKAEQIMIRVKVTDQDVLYAGTLPKNSYAHRFEVGDAEYDALGRKITEVMAVDSYNISPYEQVVYLDLSVRATYDTKSKTYSVRGSGVRFGSPMRFNLLKVTFDGYVTEFPGSNENHKIEFGVRRVETIGRGVEPFIADAVNEGDFFTNSSGAVLSKILSIRKESSERVIQDFSPQLFIRKDPLYKDIYITLEVRTKTVDGIEYLYDDIPLKIGETVPINLKNISLYPAITKIY